MFLKQLVGGDIFAYLYPCLDLHAQRPDELHFIEDLVSGHLVRRDAGRIESAGKRTLLVYHRLMA